MSSSSSSTHPFGRAGPSNAAPWFNELPRNPPAAMPDGLDSQPPFQNSWMQPRVPPSIELPNGDLGRWQRDVGVFSQACRQGNLGAVQELYERRGADEFLYFGIASLGTLIAGEGYGAFIDGRVRSSYCEERLELLRWLVERRIYGTAVWSHLAHYLLLHSGPQIDALRVLLDAGALRIDDPLFSKYHEIISRRLTSHSSNEPRITGCTLWWQAYERFLFSYIPPSRTVAASQASVTSSEQRASGESSEQAVLEVFDNDGGERPTHKHKRSAESS